MMKIKKLIKLLYMVVCNLRFFIFSGSVKKDFFIGRYASVNKLKYLFLKNNVRIGSFARLSFFDKFNNIQLSPKLSINENVYIGNHFTVLCTDQIVIEKNVIIASYVTITSENHGTDPLSDLPYGKQALFSKPITIKEGVWLGEKVTILPGVTVGEKSIIGANSVVTKDIPPYCIAVGSPAKVIKEFDFVTKSWIISRNKKKENLDEQF